MIRRSVREWEYLPIGEDGGDALPRRAADGLVATARSTRLGGAEGEDVIVDGNRRLRAQQVVGVLASPGATLEILPKIDGLDAGSTRHRLVHMLARVFDLDVADGAMTDLGWQRHDLLEILVSLFCSKLFEAVHRGLSRRYVAHDSDLAALRGRLDVRRQFTVLAASPQRLACRYEELSPDIALNQIMRAALARLLGLARAPENQRRIRELTFAFADVRAIPADRLPWDRVALDRTNSAWAGLLNLARLLLGERFQTTSAGEGRGFSLLFEMNTLFEEYVGRTLRRALDGSGLEVTLQGPRDHVLTGEDGAVRFATRPDIVVSRGGAPILIVDTKWKRLKGAVDARRGVGQGDVYQMMAYAQVYRCERLMLLYPHHDGMEGAEGVQSVHRIRGTEDTKLSVASISLADLSGLGARLAGMVASSMPPEQCKPPPTGEGP